MFGTDITQINTRHYQLALSNAALTDGQLWNDLAGSFVEDAADVAQCIRTVLLTPKGSEPLRPTFGSKLHQYIDWPINQARAPITREVFDALFLWEPRIEVLLVTTEITGTAALSCRIDWRWAQSIAEQFNSTTLDLSSGGARA